MSDAIQPLDAVAPRPLQDHAFSGGGGRCRSEIALWPSPPPCQRAEVSTHKPLGPRSGRKESRLTSRNSACGARSRGSLREPGPAWQHPYPPLSRGGEGRGPYHRVVVPVSAHLQQGIQVTLQLFLWERSQEEGWRGAWLPPTLASCLSAAACQQLPSPPQIPGCTWQPHSSLTLHPCFLSTHSVLPVIGGGPGALLHLPGAH